MPIRFIEGERPLQMGAGSSRLAAPEGTGPADAVSHHGCGSFLMVLHPAQKLVRHFARRVVLGAHAVEHPLTVEHGPKLGGGSDLLAELAGTRVGPSRFRRCPA